MKITINPTEPGSCRGCDHHTMHEWEPSSCLLFGEGPLPHPACPGPNTYLLVPESGELAHLLDAARATLECEHHEAREKAFILAKAALAWAKREKGE